MMPREQCSKIDMPDISPSLPDHVYHEIDKASRLAAIRRKKQSELDRFAEACRGKAIDRALSKADRDPAYMADVYALEGKERAAFWTAFVNRAAQDVEREWQRQASRTESESERDWPASGAYSAEDSVVTAAAVRAAFRRLEPVEQHVIATCEEVDWEYDPFDRSQKRLCQTDLERAIPQEAAFWADPESGRPKAPSFDSCSRTFQRSYLGL